MTKKLNILWVVHNYDPSGTQGGIEYYLQGLISELSSENNIYIYVADQSGMRGRLFSSHGELMRQVNFFSQYSIDQIKNSERENFFNLILSDLKINVVHFHHLINHPLGLIQVNQNTNIKSVFTFHDYYSLCHISNLISIDNQFCHPENLLLDKCDTCLFKKAHLRPGSQAQRRQYWEAALAKIDRLIFNTQGSRDFVFNNYPSLRIHSGSTILPVAAPDLPLAKKIRPFIQGESPIKIAILGGMLQHKGGEIALKVMQGMKHLDFEFHIFGEIDQGYKLCFERCNLQSITLHGKYHRNSFPSEVFDCDLSLHLSICPETYSISLTEAWQAGLIPIVSDIGALGERVIHRRNGLKVPPNDAKAVINLLTELKDDPDLLNSLKKELNTSEVSNFSSHANKMSLLYQELSRVDCTNIGSFSRSEYLDSYQPTSTGQKIFNRILRLSRKK